MKKLIILALLCAPMWGACTNTDFGNGFTCVQQKFTANAGAGTTAAATLDAATTAGNTVVVWGFACGNSGCSNSTTGLSLTVASAAGTPVEVTGGPFYYQSSLRKITAWVFSNVSAASTFTVTCGSGCYYAGIWVSEWSGITATSPLDQAAGTFSVSPQTSITVTPSDTTNSKDLLIGYLNTLSATTKTAGSGFSEIDSSVVTEAKSVNATGSNPCTWTVNTSSTWLAGCIALKGSVLASGRRRVVLIQ